MCRRHLHTMQIGDPTPGSPEALTLPLTVIQELMGQMVNRNMITTIMTTEGRINIPTIQREDIIMIGKMESGFGYTFSWGTVAGAALVTVSVIGIIVVAADDVTGIGVADDFLLGPLGAGIGEGLALILG